MNNLGNIKQMKYIGRDDVFGAIDETIKKTGEQDWTVVGVDGDGGIGKTRLLTEINMRYAYASQGILQVLKIIDFDDVYYHSMGNVEYYIVQLIGVSHFSSYLQKIKDIRKIEKSGVSVRELQRQQKEVRKEFVQDFNSYSESTRVVLSFDTIEKLEHSDVWDNLLSIFSELSNVVFFMAGRHPDLLWQKIRNTFGENNIEIIELKPLTTQDSQLYLKTKQTQLNISIDAELEKGLLLLSEGRPILLDLAIEWLSQDLPQDWMLELSRRKANKGLGTGVLKERRVEFEGFLVKKITYIRENIDRLILLLSRIYPLSVIGVRELLRVSSDEAQELYERATEIVFFKELPNDKISLHDEMRRMVNEHVWNEIDPTEIRQKYDSKLASVYLKKQLEKIEEEIIELDKQHNKKEIIDYVDVLAIGALEREKRVLAVRYLKHLAYSDIDRGVEEFKILFDGEVSLLARDSLMSTMMSYLNKLQDDRKFDLVSRKIKLLNDKGEFDEAITYAEQPTVNTEQRLDILSKIANAKLRMGNVSQAVEELHSAMGLAELSDRKDYWLTSLSNMLGQAYRIMGRLAKASRFYENALDIVQKNPAEISKTQMAAIFNNLSYVLSLEGRYQIAYRYCSMALEIREQLGTKLEVGMSLSTFGEVYRNWRKYEDALVYYDKALQIFEPENVPLWLARVYSQRGAVYRLTGQYQEAEKDLVKSISFEIPIEKPAAYHVLGLVYWNRDKDYERALEYLQKSDELALAADDTITRANNMVAFAEISYEQWMEKKDSIFLERITDLHEKLQLLLVQDYNFPIHIGRIKRVLGDIAFEEGNYELARDIYAVAYYKLGQRASGYGKRNFLDEISFLSEKLKKLANIDANTALYWCESLHDYWSDETKELHRRDELVGLCNSSRIGIVYTLNWEKAEDDVYRK